MISVLLFLSGFSALVYQVFWMRDLAVLFGSSAHAAAIVLAVFFGGLAAGAALFARTAPRVRNPLRVYGFLELGVGASALLFVLLIDASGRIYAPLYRMFADWAPLLTGLHSLLAVIVLGLPTMLMGATLPAMVQHQGHSAWLYGMNTAGAAGGAFAAGFYLPPVFGFRRGYLLAVALNVLAGLVALAASRTPVAVGAREGHHRAGRQPSVGVDGALSTQRLFVLAFASGALTIGLEVTWLRMFSQVLDNSVYAFSAVVVVALIAFSLASLVVERLAARADFTRLVLVLAAAGAAAAAQAPLFVAFTDDLTSVAGDGWLSYIRHVFSVAALFVGAGGFVAGFVFPLLLRRVPTAGAGGITVGRLLAANTVGAIAGSLLVTFVIVRWLGTWATFGAIGFTYAMLALWLARYGRPRGLRAVAVLALLATCGAAAISAMLPRVRLDAARGERVIDLREGAHGTVAVTQSRDGRLLRLNNSYSLGGTTDRIERERIQTLIPLLLHPDPESVFFLGLGTGITAGEALRHPVKRVVVCELVPEVVRASHEYFAEWTRGLPSDRRVDIHVEDGRHYLSASDEQFDVVVSDLFVPWHAGTGMLYTREHFQIVRARLRAGGLFAQWLPLFQLNQRDFEAIARTLRAVFPHVVLWRGDFYANRPIVALMASVDPLRFDAATMLARARMLAPGLSDDAALAGVLPFYVGNLSGPDLLTASTTLNTDDRPVIEFLSPRTQWDADGKAWFVSTALVRFFERVRAAMPPDRDPYLSAVAPDRRRYVDAGRFYYRAIVARLRGDDEAAEADLVEALERLPADVQVGGPFMALEPLVR